MSLTDDELRALFTVRPDDFVRVRNELARSMRKDDRRGDADELAALRRPSPFAWALNRVAHDNGELVSGWFSAAERLRNAMNKAMRGDSDDVRVAQAEERRAVDAIVAAARRQLDELGQRHNETAAQRIAGTVRAASLDAEVARHLRAGTLETDVVASGFGFGDMSVDETRSGASARRKEPAAPNAKQAATAKAAPGKKAADAGGTERRAKERDAAARRAEHRAETTRLAKAAASAAATAEKAQRTLDELRAQVDQLQGRLRDAERDARRSRNEAEQAESALRRARGRDDA